MTKRHGMRATAGMTLAALQRARYDTIMSPEADILGAILAGGASRRMGGGDKALIDLGGRPMLAHVLARFQPQVSRLVLNANGAPDRFAAFGLPVVPDGAHAGEGPLAGLLAVMDWARINAPSASAVATVSGDVPFLPLDLVTRLRTTPGPASSPRIAHASGRNHATIGLWPLTLRARVAAALEGGRRGVEAFAHDNAAIAVPFPFSDIGSRLIDPFFNANTPDDLAAARALLSGTA